MPFPSLLCPPHPPLSSLPSALVLSSVEPAQPRSDAKDPSSPPTAPGTAPTPWPQSSVFAAPLISLRTGTLSSCLPLFLFLLIPSFPQIRWPCPHGSGIPAGEPQTNKQRYFQRGKYCHVEEAEKAGDSQKRPQEGPHMPMNKRKPSRQGEEQVSRP